MGMICVGDKKIADTTPDLTAYALQEDVDNEFENVVYKTDISKNITSDSTDAQVASAKAVFTGLANKPEIDDDDEGESELTVWSAKKVHDELENATKIDDTSTTATDKTWSAKKISDSLVDIEDDLGELEKKVTFEGGVSKTRFGVDNGVAYSDIVDGTETHRLVMSKDEQRLAYNHYTGTTLDKAFELATMDKVAHDVDTSYMSGGVLNISSIRQSLGIGCYEIMGQGSAGHGSVRLNIWSIANGAIVFSCCITDFSGVRSVCGLDESTTTIDIGTLYFNRTNKIIKIF